MALMLLSQFGAAFICMWMKASLPSSRFTVTHSDVYEWAFRLLFTLLNTEGSDIEIVLNDDYSASFWRHIKHLHPQAHSEEEPCFWITKINVGRDDRSMRKKMIQQLKNQIVTVLTVTNILFYIICSICKNAFI